MVVIGGGSGIGRSAAVRFAEEGAHVVVADLDATAAESVAGTAAGPVPGRAIGVGVDVRDDASLDALFRRVVLEFGGLDALFYSAGAAPRFAPIERLAPRRPPAAAGGPLPRRRRRGRQGRRDHAPPGARRRDRGVGVEGGSGAGKEAAAYGASKAALLQALRVAAVELGPDRIRVNAINADQIDTPVFRQFVKGRAASRGISEEEQLEMYRLRNLMGVGLIPPEAVADLAVLLASDKLRFTTGAMFPVDGGLPEAFPR